MSTGREAIRDALLAKDEHIFVRALARAGDAATAARIAAEELAKLDPVTRAFWAEEEPNCDGVNCHHDHALVETGLRALLERR